MELAREFENLNKSDVSLAGGKGASLGEMTKAKIPVPGGFVILSESFEMFIHKTKLNVEIDSVLHKVRHDEMHTVEKASETIQSLILNSEMPEEIAREVKTLFKRLNSKYVAVRSSATAEDSSAAAWAGQLESYLNTTEATLLENVKKCWASLFTPRAIFYRFEKNLHNEKISVAVVVQKMVESEVSGIAFSVHPVTQDKNQLIIEAGFGLGEAIVQGAITPDSYVVEKSPRRIIDKNVSEQGRGMFRGKNGGVEWRDLEDGEKQVLEDKEILELSELILNIEKHYGFPVDIEWAKEKGKFYIVQSRPITTLTNLEPEEGKTIVSKYYSREHSLFYYKIENDDNINGHPEFPEWPSIKNVVVIKEPNTNKSEIWHNREEVDYASESFEKALLADKKLFEKVVKVFKSSFGKLEPFVKKKRKILKIADLKEYYEALVGFWSPMSFAMFVPDMEKPPKDMLRKSLKLREETQHYADIFDDLYLDYFESNFPKYKDISRYVFPEEIFVLEERNFSKDELENFRKRKSQGYVMINGELTFYPELKNILTKYKLELERVKSDNIHEIKGSIACKGVVKGKVKLVLNKEDLKSVKKGEILVTEMTSPDFVPAINKCAAIVTDEGGIASHAAIVARELSKPCVIGTKIATQVLKTGDEVEVDADEGVIRIIKSDN